MGIALITGGSSGIGRALTLALADEGYDVIVVGRDQARVDEVAALAGGRGCVCDVADAAAVQALAAEIGAPDVLVFNAGVTTAGPFVEHSAEDWAWVHGVVLGGVVNGVQAFLPAMTARGSGQILITGSFVGIVPDYYLNHGPYTAAKGGVTSLAASLRAELEPLGIGVSLLVSAGVHTNLGGTMSARPSTVAGEVDGDVAPNRIEDIVVRSDAPRPDGGVDIVRQADEVAARAVAGLRKNEAFIVTHPELRPVVEEYFGRILTAFEEAELSAG